MSSSRPSRPSQPSQPSRPSRPSHPSNTSRSSQSSKPLAPVAQDTNILSEPTPRPAGQKPLCGPGNTAGRTFELSGREEDKENVEAYGNPSRRSRPSRPSQPSRPSHPTSSKPSRKEIKGQTSSRASTHSTDFAIYTPPIQPPSSSAVQSRRAPLHSQLSELRVDDTPQPSSSLSSDPASLSVMGTMSEVAKRENKENIPPGTVFLDDDEGLSPGGQKGKKAGKTSDRGKGKGKRM